MDDSHYIIVVGGGGGIQARVIQGSAVEVDGCAKGCLGGSDNVLRLHRGPVPCLLLGKITCFLTYLLLQAAITICCE